MEIYVSDFNSDGLKDMMVVCKNGYHIFKNNGGTKGADGIVRISFSRFGPFTGSINADSDGDINRAGDFNGDGLLDIITRRGAEWCLYLGTGTLSLSSHFNKIVLTNIEARDEEEAKDDEKDDCIVTDFDHDGKSDIIIYNATYRESTVTWYKSNGTSFTKNRTVTPNDIEYYYKGHSAVGDFDGDGREDLFIYSSDFFNSGKDPGKGFVYGCFNKDYDANLLKKISSGINRYGGSNTNTVEIKYQPLTCPETPDGKDFYQKGNTAKYPVADLLAPLYAVSKTIAAAGERRETDYSYAGGKVHLTGRGFLGFEEITAKNDTRNVKIKTTTVYDYEKCLPERQIAVTSTTDDKMISTVENTFTNTKSGKIYTSVLNKTIETNHLNTLSKTTEYLNYDAQGNLTQSKITQGGLTIEENTVFAQKGAWAWGANKPVFITTVYKQTDGDTHTRKRSFDYDTQGRITNDTIDPDDDNELVTLYSNYDVFGNLQTITTKTKVMDESGSYSDVSRTVTATYTPSGRFLHTKENPPGETTTFEWDEKRGVLNSVTDYYNRKTAYGYDNFGRLKLTVYPDGNKTVNTLQWAGEISGKPYNAKYYRYCETSGQSPVWTWHDASDREIRTDSYGLNGKKISVNTQYNSNGKVFRIREPYFADVYTPEGWAVEYEYDEFGRTAKITTNAGTTGYTYSGLTTTVSSPAETRKTTINQAGWVVEEETNGKKVNFTHYASGLVKSATPEGGTGSIEMNYDLQGNRISIKDPDAGIVESRYDGFGQLSRSSQKVHINAPEEVKTTHIYHADGRLDYTKTEGKETNLVTYEYDANMRVETILQNNHRQTFTYDDLDRVTNVKEEIDSRVFEHQTSYDAFGRVARETFPSGYYTINKYDKYGFLTSVKDNSARLIRQIIDENAKGQVTQEKRGGQTTKYTYDKRGFMTYALFSNIPDLTSIGYAYDGKGNLSSKTLTGASNQQTARYTYDSNNRLTDWVYSSPMYATTGENGQPVYTTQRHHVTYDATTGNITAKSDLNGYVMTYGENGKPHALTSIADRPDVFPSDNLAAAYTDFKKLKSLTEGNKRYSLTYGVDGQRRKSVYEIDHVAEQTKYYTGNYEEVTEKDGNIRKIHYLHGAVFIDNSTKEDEFYYVYVDNIGSLTALVNEDGTVAEHYAYDPWGNRLNPKDWRERDARSVRKLSRGFTMHEHIDRFGIINMNGRVYDPLTSQFLSPDPYIQAPADWVNYNRYAYCMNNPLSYIDPSGEIAWFVPVIIGAVIGGTSGAIIGHSKDAKGWDMVGYIAGGAVIGGLSGGAASGVSALGGAAWWAGATAGAVGGAGFNGLVTSWDAGAMLKGAGIGALSGFVGGGLGSAIGGGWGAFAGGAAGAGRHAHGPQGHGH